jgi:Spy/CpxP family protein refolding chaperone
MSRQTRPRRLALAILSAIVVASVLVTAQGRGGAARGGGGGGSGGGRRGGGGGGGFSSAALRPRFAAMTDAFSLDEAQRKQVKSIMDAEHKQANALREALVKARAALGVAIESDQPPAVIDAAVADYAAKATAMAQAEMKALAQIVTGLTAEQRANQPGLDAVFFMMRGALFDKKWDSVPGGRGY